MTAKKQALLKSHAKNVCFNLPKGSVGTKSTAEVKVGEDHVTYLLDTSSQVVTVPHLFYKQHLSTHEIKAEVPTLTLVVPDVRAASQFLELIGTNTLESPIPGTVWVNPNPALNRILM